MQKSRQHLAAGCDSVCILAALSFLYLAFLFPTPEYPGYNSDDGSFFVTMAINLSEHGRYTTDTFFSADYGHHATWPFAFPSFLAVLISIFGVSWPALKIAMVTLGLVNLHLLQRYWENDRSGQWAVILTGLSPAYFLYSHHTMTEVPYLLLVVATLLAIQKSKSVGAALGAGALGMLAFYTRGYAVTLIPAAIFFYALQSWQVRQRISMALAFLFPMVAGVIAWKLYTSHVAAVFPLDYITSNFGTGSGILSNVMRPLHEYAQRIYWHDMRYPLHFIVPLVSLDLVLHSDILAAVSVALAGLVVLGWVESARKRLGVLEIWLPIAIIFVLLPLTSAARYWFTFLPFMFYYLLTGLTCLGDRIHALRPVYPVALFLLVISAVTALGLHFMNPDQLRFVSPAMREYRDIAIWARTGLPPKAAVIAPAPHKFYSVSLKPTYPVELVTSPRLAQAELTHFNSMYVLCSIQDHEVSVPLTRLCEAATEKGTQPPLWIGVYWSLYPVSRIQPIHTLKSAR